jgi:chromosome segregation ATPase
MRKTAVPILWSPLDKFRGRSVVNARRKVMRYSVFLLAGVFLLQGCGYSLRMVDVAEENRELRNKREMEALVLQLDGQMKEMQAQVTRLQADLKQTREESRKGISDLQKRRADVDVRFDENELQLRMIQGKIEKEERRRADIFQQVDNAAFRLNEQEKNVKNLQGQIEELKKVNAAFQKYSEDQDKRLKEITGQIVQLAQEIPSSLTAHAAQLEELGRQIQRVSRDGDVEQLGKSLADLSSALNLLGEKITAKVDEQEKLLSKTTKRLQALESKLAPKGKQSSLQEERSSGASLGESGEKVDAAWHQ